MSSVNRSAPMVAVMRVDDVTLALHKPRVEPARRHVLNRDTQSKAGRLYCSEDLDFDIPALELYAAR